jgi:hypothetical protein
MVEFLDTSILGYFSIIFTFLLVFVILYGLLSLTRPFGEGKNGLYAIVAFAFAILSISSRSILNLITFVTPWFFMLIFISFFVLFVLMIFGLKADQVKAGLSSELRTWVIILTVVILIFGIGATFGQQTLEEGRSNTGENTGQTDPVVSPDPGPDRDTSTATDDFTTNVMNALFNPQVLGLIVVMLVGAFAMFLLTKTQMD